MATIEKVSTSSKSCFVCDTTITGKYHALANYKLKFSKKEIIEKLGTLVGDKYVVICKTADVICQRCVTIMETLDKLESETASAKRLILRFIDKKYSLDNDSLSSSHETENAPIEKEGDRTIIPSFAAQKRKSQEAMEQVTEEANDDPRSRIWLKCDTCQYTTNYTTFVERHIRKAACLLCGASLRHGICTQRCGGRRVIAAPQKNTDPPVEESPMCAPIMPNSFFEDQDAMVSNDEVEEGHLNLPEDEEEGDASSDKRPLYFQVVDENPRESRGVREVFTVANNGAVETVRVMWDEEADQPAALL